MAWHPTHMSADTTSSPPARSITLGGQAVVLAVADGFWYAIEDRCSHAGCAFSEDGDISGTQVICNCHGSEFDLRTGLATRPPARDPIRTFQVRIVAGFLDVEV